MTRRTWLAAIVASLAIDAAAGAESDRLSNITVPEWTRQQVAEFFEEGEPACTQEQAEAWATEVRPLVEEICGRTFDRMPTIRVVTRADLIEALTQDMTVVYRAMAPTPDADVEFAAMLGAEVAAPLVCACYCIERDEVLLPAGNTRGMLRLLGREQTPIPDVMRLAIAHEMTHALQRQTLGGIRWGHGPAQVQGLRAVMEGHAFVVQERVAAQLGLEAANEALLAATKPARIIDEEGNPVDTSALSGPYGEVYRDGLAFVDHHLSIGGMERIWQTLANPPRSPDEVRRPERWGQPTSWPGAEAAFAHVRETVAAPDWQVTVQELTERHVRVNLARAGAGPAERVAAALRHGGLCAAQRSDASAILAILLMEFGTESDSEKALAAMRADTVAKMEMQRQRGVEVGPLSEQAFKSVKGAQSTILFYTFSAMGQTREMRHYRVARGRHVIDMSLMGGTFAPDVVTDLIEGAFEAVGAKP